MKKHLYAITAAASLLSTSALAEVLVKDAWVRATPGAAKVSAGYAVLVNTGPSDDLLTGARTPAASMAEVHATVGADGIMRMEKLEELVVPAGKEVALAPGSYHIMIMGLNGPLKVGEKIPLVLTFKNQGEVEVTAEVRPLASRGMK